MPALETSTPDIGGTRKVIPVQGEDTTTGGKREVDLKEKSAQRQLKDLIQATGMETLGDAMVTVREWRFERKLTESELNYLLSLLKAEQVSAVVKEQDLSRGEDLIKWCNEQIAQLVRHRRRRVMPDYDQKLKEWLS